MKKFKIFVSLVLIFALFFNLSLAQRPRIYYKSPTPPPEHPTTERSLPFEITTKFLLTVALTSLVALSFGKS